MASKEMRAFVAPNLKDLCIEVFYKDLVCKATEPQTIAFVRDQMQQFPDEVNKDIR